MGDLPRKGDAEMDGLGWVGMGWREREVFLVDVAGVGRSLVGMAAKV